MLNHLNFWDFTQVSRRATKSSEVRERERGGGSSLFLSLSLSLSLSSVKGVKGGELLVVSEEREGGKRERGRFHKQQLLFSDRGIVQKSTDVMFPSKTS